MASLLIRTYGFGSNLIKSKAILSQARIVAQQSKWSELLTTKHASTVSATSDKDTARQSSTISVGKDAGTGTDQVGVKTQVTVVPDEEDGYRERYIPVTRRSLIRYLVEQENFFTEEEKKKFEDFALALDSAIVNKYHGVLQELKTLFDPINPDKDTVQTRKWSPRERQDNEFWLLQRLDDIMEKANFHELPKSVVKKAMEEHDAAEGVRVSVDASKYDILKFWALGKETPQVKVPWYQQIMWKYTKPPTPVQYYKRVVVAIRLKKDQKLILKSFKEIPVGSLEMMLPNGRIQIRTFDKYVIGATVSVASVGIIAKLVTLMAHLSQDVTPAISLILIIIAVRAWTAYKNKRTKYLADLSSTLYFKNIANNRGLLALLVDRAEDESFKEALLAYSFLLANRPPSLREKASKEQQPSELGGIPKGLLEENVQEWILEKTGTKIEVDMSEAIKLLTSFGIMSAYDYRLHVLPMEAAIRNLPQQPQSLVARAAESDISEGYDREDFLETQEQFEKRDSKSKGAGWD